MEPNSAKWVIDTIEMLESENERLKSEVLTEHSLKEQAYAVVESLKTQLADALRYQTRQGEKLPKEDE